MRSPAQLLHDVRSQVRDTRRDRRERAARRRLYRSILSPGDLVFDVGANVGNRTEAFLAVGARVVAVEPQADCARELRSRFASNPDVVVLQQALGDTPGRGSLFVADESTISSMALDWIASVQRDNLFPGHRWSEEPVEVAVTTLDELIARHGVPVFCKIDVEGYEQAVLAGLSQPLPLLSLEFTGGQIDRTAQAIERLEALGNYRYAYSVGETMRLELPWREADAFIAGLRQTPDHGFGDVYARAMAEG